MVNPFLVLGAGEGRKESEKRMYKAMWDGGGDLRSLGFQWRLCGWDEKPGGLGTCQ